MRRRESEFTVVDVLVVVLPLLARLNCSPVNGHCCFISLIVRLLFTRELQREEDQDPLRLVSSLRSDDLNYSIGEVINLVGKRSQRRSRGGS